MNHKPFYIQLENLYIVPVCHYKFEFAWYVMEAVKELSPDVIAVELPSTLKEYITKAVERFPYLSVIFYQNNNGDYIYFPVEPSDPLCEAVRSGMEMNIPVHFIDLDVDDYPLFFDPMPDPYAIYKIGLEVYWKTCLSVWKRFNLPVYEADEKRETHMTYYLQKLLNSGDKVLFICGMAHVQSIIDKMKIPQIQPIGKVIRKEIRIFNLSPDSIREVTGEIPFNIAVYESMRGKHKEEPVPQEDEDDHKIISLLDKKKHIEESKVKAGDVDSFESKAGDVDSFESYEEEIEKNEDRLFFEVPFEKYSAFMNKLMKLLTPKFNSMINPAAGETGNLSSDFIGLELLEPKPYKIKPANIHKFLTSEDRREDLMKFYKEFFGESSEDFPLPDRQKLMIGLIKRTATYYQENTGEEIKPWQFDTFVKFASNYALVTGALLPDFFQLITCGRSVADDNYAYEIWDLGSFYPWIDRSGKFQTVDIKAEHVWLHGKKIMLRRKFPRLRKLFRPLYLKDRKKEKKPGDWTKDFDGLCICSYPPEDIVIEDYGLYLKQKGKHMLSQEQARVIPFSSSLLDGIDVKETIRNWHDGKRLYVKEARQIAGGVGSVVVIFDEDEGDCGYPWRTTWQGEHGQESDMAFYATLPTDKIVGPGIARCEYGGFMMSYPPMRVWDVWSDPFYDSARSKSELLLMAAIEYSLEQYIIYVAAKAPRTWFQSFAGRLNKKVKYLPIGSLSPVTLKKIRVFHVLSKRQVRKYAKDYVW
jgi:hypothetical protein